MRRIPAILLSAFPERDDVAREAAERWGGDPSTLDHVSTGANFTYRFAAPSAPSYLRLMPPGWRSLAELSGSPSNMSRQRASRWRAQSNRVMASASKTCRADAARASRSRSRRSTGDSSDDEYWSTEQAREAGGLMARLHLAAEDFELPPGAERPSWQDEFDSLEDELPRDESELCRIIERTHALSETLPQSRDC